MLLKEVSARSIIDSRGEKTIEVSVNGVRASSPSGKSTGKYETKTFYKSLDFCIKFLNSIQTDIEIGKFDDLKKIEEFIENKLKIKQAREFGGNSLFAFESAILKALAKEQKKELWQVVNSKAKKFPRPVGNAIGGGLHTDVKGHPTFQEFLIVPKEKSFGANVEVMNKVYRELGRQLNTSKVNDEGAWAASVDDEQVLAMLSRFNFIDFGIDCASSSFYKNNLYFYKNGLDRTREPHIGHVSSFVKNYGVFYLEDPVQEEDFAGFAEIRKSCREAMVVGDDLTATHLDRVKKAIERRSISAMIVKPNQNGSLVEVKKIVELCKKRGIKTVMSHRSGETMDDGLADYAFAFQTDFIKCGIATKWRECKLKRMISIEKSLK